MPGQGVQSQTLDSIIAEVTAADAETVARGVRRARRALPRLTADAFVRLVDALGSLAYIDSADLPEFEPVLRAGVRTLASAGSRVVAPLLAQMQGADIKSHLYIADVLGLVGEPAMTPLRHLAATAQDRDTRVFALYAIGKVTDPSVLRAIPEALGCCMHPDKEVRDTAVRALGRVFASQGRGVLKRQRAAAFDVLQRCVADPEPAVRAKAIRSLGKMADVGCLDRKQLRWVAQAARVLAGHGEGFDADAAFVVRREAQAVHTRLSP